MDEKTKATLDQINSEADTVTNWTLGKVVASKWSAVIMVALLLAAFGVGVWLGHKL